MVIMKSSLVFVTVLLYSAAGNDDISPCNRSHVRPMPDFNLQDFQGEQYNYKYASKKEFKSKCNNGIYTYNPSIDRHLLQLSTSWFDETANEWVVANKTIHIDDPFLHPAVWNRKLSIGDDKTSTMVIVVLDTDYVHYTLSYNCTVTRKDDNGTVVSVQETFLAETRSKDENKKVKDLLTRKLKEAVSENSDLHIWTQRNTGCSDSFLG